jgi:hypothetical protein
MTLKRIDDQARQLARLATGPGGRRTFCPARRNHVPGDRHHRLSRGRRHQAERRLGLAERLAAVIPNGRDQSRVTHLLPDILRARIFAIACGSFEPRRRANGGMRWPPCDRACRFGFF